MKYDNSFFMQVSRKLFQYSYEELPVYSRWIFTVLNELEQRFTGKGEDFFFRSDSDLANDCGLSVRTIQRYKKHLIDLDMVQHWNMHFINTDTGKKSEKKISAYRILV